MTGMDYGDLFAWAFIAAAAAFAIMPRGLPAGAALGGAVLAGMIAKTFLLELV